VSEVATALVQQFDRMVRRDGGSVTLLGVNDGVIRVGYRIGADATCSSDACVLPEAELTQLMSETLSRRDPSLQVVVEVIR
jgi:Fe-S cluster biogenesis protein NfuA